MQTFEIISEENPNDIGSTSVALGLHMDLQYYESPPGLQLLQCLRCESVLCTEIQLTYAWLQCQVKGKKRFKFWLSPLSILNWQGLPHFTLHD